MNKEFAQKLRSFAEAYLEQQEAMKGNLDDQAMTRAVLTYMKESRSLTEYITLTFKEEEPKLPSMEVFFSNGQYHDYARRIYAGILNSGHSCPDEAWRLAIMVEIGNVLKEKTE